MFGCLLAFNLDNLSESRIELDLESIGSSLGIEWELIWAWVRVPCRIKLSAPVPVPFLWTLDFGFGTSGFGTWILDLDLGLDLGLTILNPWMSICPTLSESPGVCGGWRCRGSRGEERESRRCRMGATISGLWSLVSPQSEHGTLRENEDLTSFATF